jgi:hypothetical protein
MCNVLPKLAAISPLSLEDDAVEALINLNGKDRRAIMLRVLLDKFEKYHC